MFPPMSLSLISTILNWAIYNLTSLATHQLKLMGRAGPVCLSARPPAAGLPIRWQRVDGRSCPSARSTRSCRQSSRRVRLVWIRHSRRASVGSISVRPKKAPDLAPCMPHSLRKPTGRRSTLRIACRTGLAPGPRWGNKERRRVRVWRRRGTSADRSRELGFESCERATLGLRCVGHSG
jgi:hypothetical protein